MTTLTKESEALLESFPRLIGLHRTLVDIEVAAATRERERIATAFEPLWDHWYNGIGWFDAGDDYHLTQMTVADYEKLSDLMRAFRAILEPEGETT